MTKNWLNFLNKITIKTIMVLIYFWHYFLGYLVRFTLGQVFCCRFHPSCSIYTKEAIIKFGLVKGAKLGLIRIFKCQPFGKFGPDFV